MAYEVDLEELQREETVNTDKILDKYFSPEHVELKTEINAPSAFTTLENITKHFNELINFNTKKIKGEFKFKHDFSDVQEVLQNWINTHKINMVTYKRKSRNEVAEVLKALKQQEINARSWSEKLTGMGKGKE